MAAQAPPRASLSDLPRNVKTRIAVQVKLMEKVYREPFNVFKGWQLDEDMTVGGRAPIAMSRLSKSITLHQVTYEESPDEPYEDLSFFRGRIIPRYGAFIKQIRFQGDEYGDADDDENEGEDDEAYEPGCDGGEEEEDAAASWPAPVPLVPGSFAQLLYSLPSLESLDLSYRSFDDVPSLSHPLRLKRLRLHAESGLEHLEQRFFRGIAPTLETLILERFWFPWGSYAFPRLTHLALAFASPGYYHLNLAAFRSAPLEYLYVDTVAAGHVGELLEAAQAHAATLRTLRIGGKYLYVPSEREKAEVRRNLDALKAWCVENNVKTTLPQV
ncbi:hypothetical protein JCM8097_008107 [Rhodosporidiobolus ruineniae]